jgi:hypothetical protein
MTEEEFEGECAVCGSGYVPATGVCSKVCAEQFTKDSDEDSMIIKPKIVSCGKKPSKEDIMRLAAKFKGSMR